MAGGAVAPAWRERRRGAAGIAWWEGDRAQPADDRARGSASSTRAGERGPGDHTVRDTTGPPAADRLRGTAHRDWGPCDEGVPVRGDAGLLAPDACAGVPERAPGELAGGSGEHLPALRRGDERGPLRQRPRAREPPRGGDARGHVQREVPGLRSALELPAAGL